MPIFRYFIVVGPVLLAFIVLAGAQLPPPGPLTNSTNFYGVDSGVRKRPAPTILRVETAPEPDMNSPEVLAAAPQPTVTVTKTAKSKPARVAKSEAPKKRKRVVRNPAWHDEYAQAWRFGPPTGLW